MTPTPTRNKGLAHAVKIRLSSGSYLKIAVQDCAGISILEPRETDMVVTVQLVSEQSGQTMEARGFASILEFLFGAAVPLEDNK